MNILVLGTFFYVHTRIALTQKQAHMSKRWPTLDGHTATKEACTFGVCISCKVGPKVSHPSNYIFEISPPWGENV